MNRKKSEKKSGKRWLAAALLMAVVISSLGNGMTAIAAVKKNTDVTTTEYTEEQKAYCEFAQKLQAKTNKKLYYAVINASATGAPVLLVSNSVFGKKKKQSVAAEVYSYHNGKVFYITKMQSTGAGYPLLWQGQYIISGWHHASYRLKVAGKKGYVNEVSGFGMMTPENCCLSSWTVKKGKKSNITKKKISSAKAEKLDYYNTATGKEILFQKVS